jgi:hypothetical protein
LFRLLRRSHCRQVFFTPVCSFSIHLPASLGSSDRYSPSVCLAPSCGLSACLRYYGRSDSCHGAVLRPLQPA